MIDPNNPLLAEEAMDFEQFQRNNHLRITVGTEEQMDKLIEALEELLSK